MDDVKYYLTCNWTSKHNVHLKLYLGYEEDKMSCVDNKELALQLTMDECNDWLSVLNTKYGWTTEQIVEESNNAEGN